MKLSFKFKPNINKKQLEIIEELSYHTTKLYNIINYDLRENGVKTYYDIKQNQDHLNLKTLIRIRMKSDLQNK